MSVVSETKKLISKGSDFDVNTLNYSKPKVNAKGGKSVKVQDASHRTFIMSTPLMLTWGVNENQWDENGPKKYDMSLQFPSEDYSNSSITSFLENMKDFENKLLDDACGKHCKEWFNKSKMTRDVAEALWNPMLRYPKDKETGEPDMTRMPTFRHRLPYWDEKFNVELYDMDQQLLFGPSKDNGSTTPVSFIPKTSHVSCIVQCGGLYFAGGKFGVTWDLIQAVVRPPARIAGSCFVELDEADHATVANVEEREARDADKQDASVFEQDEESTGVEVADSEEEEDEEEEAPAPPPKKVVKKKRVVKKKV